MAKGLLVKERISATTSWIAVGARPCAPKEPRPPKFDTAAVRGCAEKPPSGPWMIGYSMPSWLETRVLFHAEFGFAIIKCLDFHNDFNCRRNAQGETGHAQHRRGRTFRLTRTRPGSKSNHS